MDRSRTATPLLEVSDLDVVVSRDGEWRPAVTGATFRVDQGEVLAIVGESGSGKSLMAMGCVDLLRSGAEVESGTTRFQGHTLQDLGEGRWRELVGMGIGTLFQDPLSSWDPLEMIGEQSGEVLSEHTDLADEEIERRVLDALGEVKLPRKRKFLSFSYQMSRGEAQRAMLAAVLLSSPQLLIADEPVSGLDTTIAQAVLSLIDDLRTKRGMGMILVTHDLGVVAGIADRVAVVYGGTVVEEGPVNDIFKRPQHPYTEGLLGSIPWPGVRRLRAIPGEAPHITQLPAGCAFWPRCEYAEGRCRSAVPAREPIGHSEVRCHRAWGLELRGVGAE